jgi:hypothetical protein
MPPKTGHPQQLQRSQAELLQAGLERPQIDPDLLSKKLTVDLPKIRNLSHDGKAPPECRHTRPLHKLYELIHTSTAANQDARLGKSYEG